MSGSKVNLYNITMTSADTEYEQEIPGGARRLEFQCQGAFAIRYAFVTGKVATPTAPYKTLKANGIEMIDGLFLSGIILYLASSEAAQVVELEVWR